MKQINDREQKMETAHGRLSMLNKAVLRINEILDLDRVAQEVVESARTLTDARYGVVALQKDSPRDFRVSWASVGEEFPTWVDLSGNAFPATPSYTITGLRPGGRYKVRVRARYDGPPGVWSDTVEAVVATVAPDANSAKTRVSAATQTLTSFSRAVRALNVVSNQPGELTVSWDAPDDSGLPHDLFTTGMSPAEGQLLEKSPERMPFFTYLNRLSEPLRVSGFDSLADVGGLPDYWLIPMTSFLAAPIRHQGLSVGSICLAREKREHEFSQEDEEFLELFAAQAALSLNNAHLYRSEKKARAALKTVVDTSPVGVAVFNARSGNHRSLNREAMRIIKALDQSNRPLKEILKILTVRRADGQEMSLNEFILALVQGDGETARTEELALSLHEGRSNAALVNVSNIRGAKGKVESVVATIQDMSPFEELEKMRSEFLGMVSHELRSPLTSIKGSAVTLRESLDTLGPAETGHFVRIIEMQADRMRDLISELLDIALIETGSLSVAPEPADVVALVEEARTVFQSGDGRDKVSIDLETKIPLVMADKRRVVQVLDNLLTNAAKYSNERSEIWLRAHLDDAHVAISVADQGRGVSPERIQYLFRKFGRIDDRGKLEVAGSGLGLAICKGIVEAHGGRIWAESSGLGKGAKFTFTLPVVDENVHDAASDPSLYSAATRTSVSGPKRILAVDDDPRTLRYVQDVLFKAGYSPIVTGNPEEVLKIVKSDQPHLVLLDLMMPGSDGIELMKSILAATEVPVMFLSAYGRDEVIATALQSGATDYMVKPFSPTELVARVETAMRRQLPPVQDERLESYVLGDLFIDYVERKVTIAGRPISLTVTEYNLLYALSTRAGRVLTHAEMLQNVWNMDPASDRSVIRTNIRRLRGKLEDNADNPTYIFAEPRVGYRMAKAETLEQK